MYGGVVVLIGYFNVLTSFSNPFALVALIVLLAILKFFSSLTVTVDDQVIKVQFGVGVYRKIIPLKEIESYAVVKNPWYYGWGIRYTPRGWLFNVSGSRQSNCN